MYGDVEGKIEFPRTPEEWASERWYNFTVRHDPHLPWLPQAVKEQIDNFELVVNSRWPTIQDIHLPRLGPQHASFSELVALRSGRLQISV